MTDTPPTEHERRFLLLDFNRSILYLPPTSIDQGYLETPADKELRCRIKDKKEGFLTAKEGTGRSRLEPEISVPLDVAQFIFQRTPHRLFKQRRYLDGWEIDQFLGPLEEIFLAEFEGTEKQLNALEKPSWVKKWIEVTDSLSNRHLAILATSLRLSKESKTFTFNDLLPRLLPPPIPKFVLTGGPGSGKSTMMTKIKEKFGDQVHCVPEVATILFDQVGVRPFSSDSVAQVVFQLRLASVQRIFEDLSTAQAIQEGKKAIILDRGIPDSAAYLPGGVKQLCEVLNVSETDLFKPYHTVIRLSVPAKKIYDRIKNNNPSRTETYEQACLVQERLTHTWNTPLVDFCFRGGYAESWDAKEQNVLAEIESFLNRLP